MAVSAVHDRRGSNGVFGLGLKVIAGVVALWFVYAIVTLTINFLLLFFGANLETGFAVWIIDHASSLIGPFDGMFSTYHPVGNSVFDASMLAAILIYTLIGSALSALIAWFSTLLNN